MFKSEIGDEVRLQYDSDVLVQVGDFIKTRTGRCYEVTAARMQTRGVHQGRYHLKCIVVKEETRGAFVHPLFWYKRNRSRV